MSEEGKRKFKIHVGGWFFKMLIQMHAYTYTYNGENL